MDEEETQTTKAPSESGEAGGAETCPTCGGPAGPDHVCPGAAEPTKEVEEVGEPIEEELEGLEAFSQPQHQESFSEFTMSSAPAPAPVLESGEVPHSLEQEAEEVSTADAPEDAIDISYDVQEVYGANAPQYAAGAADYETRQQAGRADVERDISGGALMARDVTAVQQRGVDVRGFQERMSGLSNPTSQAVDERDYYISVSDKKDEDKLPPFR